MNIHSLSKTMLSKHLELTLTCLILIAAIQLIVLFLLKRDNIELKDINKKLKDTNKKLLDLVRVFNQDNSTARTTNSRILVAIQSNGKDIKNLKKQMNQVHKWLGDVLGISNLIPNEDHGIDSTAIIEELRRRVKWAKELENQEIDEADFYKGD